MTTELIGRAHQDTDKQTIKTHPRLASTASTPTVIAEVLFEASTWGDEDQVRLSQVWEAIEARIPRERVRAAAATVAGMVPPPEAIPDGNWRVPSPQIPQAQAQLGPLGQLPRRGISENLLATRRAQRVNLPIQVL